MKKLYDRYNKLVNYIIVISLLIFILKFIKRLHFEHKEISLIFFLIAIIITLLLLIAWYVAGKKIKSAIQYNIKWKYLINDLWIPIAIAIGMTFVIDNFNNNNILAISDKLCKLSIDDKEKSEILNKLSSLFSDFIVNLIITFLTFIIVLYNKVKNHIKSIDDNSHWKEYIEKIKIFNLESYALSVVSLDDFFEPIGLRYLIEQIANITNAKLNRLIIIKDNVEFKESWAQEITHSSNKWTHQERMLYNLVKISSLNDKINLYITTTYELTNFLNSNLIRLKYQDLDRLILNDTMYHPKWENPVKKNKLIFEEERNDGKRCKIIEIIKNFSNSEYQINI